MKSSIKGYKMNSKKPTYNSIIAILSNLSPYTQSLRKEVCDGLIYLVQVFAKKDFLFEKEGNCKTLESLIGL